MKFQTLTILFLMSLVTSQGVNASFIAGPTGYSGWSEMSKVEAFIISETGQGGFEGSGIQVGGVSGSTVSSTYALTTGSIPGTGSGATGINLFLSGSATGTMLVDILTYGTNGLFSSDDQSGPNNGFSGRFTYSDGIFGGVAFFTANHDIGQYDRSGGAVPEPATLALLGLGLAGIGFSRKRKAA